MLLISREKLKELVRSEVRNSLEDENIQRRVAMEYLVSLKKRDLTRFLEAVDLRRQSDEKLLKLDEAEPDIDNLGKQLEQIAHQ